MHEECGVPEKTLVIGDNDDCNKTIQVEGDVRYAAIAEGRQAQEGRRLDYVTRVRQL
jgi:hypothetical protein